MHLKQPNYIKCNMLLLILLNLFCFCFKVLSLPTHVLTKFKVKPYITQVGTKQRLKSNKQEWNTHQALRKCQ